MKLRLISFALLALLAFSSCKDKITGPPVNPATSDTIAYWPFNGNTNDVSGNGHNGSISGSASYGNNRFAQAGSALVLDHQTTVVVPSTDDLNMITGNSYTISAWVWYKDTLTLDTGSMGVSGSVLSKMPPKFQNAEETGYEIWPTRYSSAPWGLTYSAGIMNESNNGDQSFGIGGDAGAKQFPIGFNQWHMVTVVLVAHQNISLYIDSVLIESAPYEIDAQAANNDIPLTIGLLSDSSMVDDIIILHSAMSATDVQARFHEGGWYEHADTVTRTLPDSGWTQGNFGGTTANIEGLCFAWVDTVYACGFNGTILRSIDGGNTWAAQNSGTAQNLYRIRFQDWNNGIAGGDNGTLLKTTNAGAIWSQLTLPSSPSVNIRDIYWSSKSAQYPQGLMVVVGGANSGTEGVILASTDAGNTWTVALTTASGALYGIDQLLETVVGNAGQIYKYQGGTTWASVSVSGAGDDLTAIDFSSQSNGITVSAYGTVYQTNSAGASWTGPQQSPVTGALRAVSMTSQTEVWAAGANGVVLHSINNGGSWTQQSVGGFTGSWNDIEWAGGGYPAHRIAFIGDNGTLYWLNE